MAEPVSTDNLVILQTFFYLGARQVLWESPPEKALTNFAAFTVALLAPMTSEYKCAHRRLPVSAAVEAGGAAPPRRRVSGSDASRPRGDRMTAQETSTDPWVVYEWETGIAWTVTPPTRAMAEVNAAHCDGAETRHEAMPAAEAHRLQNAFAYGRTYGHRQARDAAEDSPLPPDLGCPLPPPGWWCSREPGHDGPCAARRVREAPAVTAVNYVRRLVAERGPSAMSSNDDTDATEGSDQHG